MLSMRGRDAWTFWHNVCLPPTLVPPPHAPPFLLQAIAAGGAAMGALYAGPDRKCFHDIYFTEKASAGWRNRLWPGQPTVLFFIECMWGLWPGPLVGLGPTALCMGGMEMMPCTIHGACWVLPPHKSSTGISLGPTHLAWTPTSHHADAVAFPCS